MERVLPLGSGADEMFGRPSSSVGFFALNEFFRIAKFRERATGEDEERRLQRTAAAPEYSGAILKHSGTASAGGWLWGHAAS